MDAPTSHLTYRHQNITHKVSSRGDAPELFLMLVRKTEQLAELLGWLPPKDRAVENRSELIIELDEDTSPESLIGQFVDEDLIFIKKITPTKPYYLFSVKGNQEPELLQTIRMNTSVKSAQWNHRLKKRNR